jgi:hypothetical protein
MIPMQASPDLLEQLTTRLAALEQRVATLEHRPPSPTALPAPAPTQAAHSEPAVAESPATGGIFSQIGIALLGIAGAYVLRAAAAAAFLPRGLVAAIAVLYSLAWLAAGARIVPRRASAGILFAATSILILAPMLWEMFLGFHAISGLVSALILALYAATATALAFRRAQAPVFATAYLGASISAIALSIATHEAADFAALLVAMAVVCEILRLRGRSPSIRALVLLAADFAAWMVLFLYRSPAALTGYPPLPVAAAIAIGCAVQPISAASIAVWAIRERRTLAAFDILQAAIAFLLAAAALIWMLPASGPLVLGLLSLALAAACYWAAFGPLRHIETRRNFRFFAVCSIALFLTGAILPMSPDSASAGLALTAVAAALAANHLQSRVIRLHAVLYLVAAAALSGLLTYAPQCFIGSVPPRPAWAILVVAASALAISIAGREQPANDLEDQVLDFIPLLLAALSIAALSARALLGTASAAFALGPHHIALLRTIVLCTTALVLALAGARWRLPSMLRVAYVAIALVAVKLVFEDLRHGRMEFIAASIVLVALTLMAVPRLAQRLRRSSPSAA